MRSQRADSVKRGWRPVRSDESVGGLRRDKVGELFSAGLVAALRAYVLSRFGEPVIETGRLLACVIWQDRIDAC